MERRLTLILLVFCMMPVLSAQEYRWRVGLDYFFDNREYEKSSFTNPQTFHGIWLNTLGGVAWDSIHTIYAGVNLLKIPGTDQAVNKTDVVLYYQYKRSNMLLRAGAFPRMEVLPNYSDFFFQDSVNYFMPLMQGLFWQIGKEGRFLNAWMDWTGYASANTRESFYLGLSGKTSKGIFFVDFQSYLFHYAGTFPENQAYGVSEHIEGMASLGVEVEGEKSFRGLLSAGIFAGLERDRKRNESYLPVGFTARADAELFGIGTENIFYAGNARMRLFPVHGANLYWGNQLLRGSVYLRSKWYIRLLESDCVSARINGNLHLSEGRLLLQQAFSITANIGNNSKPGKRRVNYPWMRIFR